MVTVDCLHFRDQEELESGNWVELELVNFLDIIRAADVNLVFFCFTF